MVGPDPGLEATNLASCAVEDFCSLVIALAFPISELHRREAGLGLFLHSGIRLQAHWVDWEKCGRWGSRGSVVVLRLAHV